MADNNQQVEKPKLEERALNAQKEFSAILDVLLVPLTADVADQKLPFRRRWRGGCLLKRPDLVPVNPNPNDGPEGFCRRDRQGRLIVTVKNQGDADASSSVTRVTFMPDRPESSFVDKNTNQVPAGEPLDVEPIEIPENCLASGECEFTITVDANNQVVEFDKGNNTVSGRCKGKGNGNGIP